MIICFLSLLCSACDYGTFAPGSGTAANSAKDKLEEVNSLAQSYGKGLRLMTVSSQEVRIDGTSDVWQYIYAGGSLLQTSYWFHSGAGMIAFDSNSATGVGSAAITHHWCNSDSAMFIAERNGGSQFRNQNPRCSITAGVGEPVVPNPATTWWITYRSKDDRSRSLTLGIDANTGVVTLKYP
jgi:hypothetical protein